MNIQNLLLAFLKNQNSCTLRLSTSSTIVTVLTSNIESGPDGTVNSSVSIPPECWNTFKILVTN